MTYTAGDKVTMITTYLEMPDRPTFPRPSLPGGEPSALLAAKSPPNWYFLSLYCAVGRDYEWTDRLADSDAELAQFLTSNDVTLYTWLRAGWPNGFFVLDWRIAGECDLSYFGLVPEVVGTGAGGFLLQTAIHAGWDREGVAKMTVNTCSLDHPRALSLYQKVGFSPVRQVESTRILQRARNSIGLE